MLFLNRQFEDLFEWFYLDLPKGLCFHDFRHTAITNMGKVRVDISIIMAFSGHKTMAMFKRSITRST